MMKINEIIRTRRKVTETHPGTALAEYLGISAPAVNKWEKGVSYPDITLLPPLARLLKVDLNTLLSFEESLRVRRSIISAEKFTQCLKREDIKKGMSWL